MAGNYDNLTILHEIGHTLGLKHGHEGPRAAAGRASTASSSRVMTYRSYIGATADYYGRGRRTIRRPT